MLVREIAFPCVRMTIARLCYPHRRAIAFPILKKDVASEAHDFKKRLSPTADIAQIGVRPLSSTLAATL